jgi:A/G-specific adenine glycosylase
VTKAATRAHGKEGPISVLRRRIGRKLLAWFRRHRRDLPWRHDRNPYRIWVSEVMLQQTQVATVIPYFEQFLQRFPTVVDLAAAPEQEVLRLWEGLGYYRRARHLHQAARKLVAEYQGRIPDDPAVFRLFPGIGRYILGAVLSQAFDKRLPILEANSERVLCRLLGLKENPKRNPVRSKLWHAAEDILPRKNVGDFNQALMELGALICTASKPRCHDCPLAEQCQANRLGLQQQIPLRTNGQAIVEVQEVAVIIHRGPQVFLVQRPNKGRWAEMWEFPHGAVSAKESIDEAAGRLLKDSIGFQVDLGRELITLNHAVTNQRITLICLEADYRSGKFRSDFYARGNWVRPFQLKNFPVSSPQRRIAMLLTTPRQKCVF